MQWLKIVWEWHSEDDTQSLQIKCYWPSQILCWQVMLMQENWGCFYHPLSSHQANSSSLTPSLLTESCPSFSSSFPALPHVCQPGKEMVDAQLPTSPISISAHTTSMCSSVSMPETESLFPKWWYYIAFFTLTSLQSTCNYFWYSNLQSHVLQMHQSI